MNSPDYAIGIDLGGSSVKAVAVTPDGQLQQEANVAFDAAQSMQWADRIRALIQQLQSHQQAAATAVGLSAPGLPAPHERAIAFMPGRLQGLEGLDWTDYLQSQSLIPVLNDAHAALLGERWLGAARGFSNVILLTLGTGVGGAAMVEGKLLRGHIGRAGHLGHLSLNPDGPPDITNTPGSLEDAIGNCTIRERTAGQFLSTHELIAAHLAGDSFATQVWRRSVKALAAAIASFINILDPEAVIIGGGIARSGEALFQPLAEFLETMEWRPGGQAVAIRPAELGELAGAFGAAWYGRHKVSVT